MTHPEHPDRGPRRPREDRPRRDGRNDGRKPGRNDARRDGDRDRDSDKRAPRPLKPAGPGLAARIAALDLLERVRGGEPLDVALADCGSFSELEGPDRGFARALAANALRRRGALDEVIGRFLDRPFPPRAMAVQDILRLVGVQLLILGTPAHAAVDTAVSIARRKKETAGYAKLINAVARKIGARGPELFASQPERIDTPGWLWRSWERAYGPATARKIALAHRREAPLDITLKAGEDADMWAERLEAKRLPTGSLRRDGASEFGGLPGFADGAWWVQDAAASLPARLLGDIAGKQVFDLCAAPGGKTMQLASAGAEVTAVEISAPRLQRLTRNLERTGLNARLVVEDAIRWKPETQADAVLLDAPCTATGTIRRHPDALILKAEADVETLVRLQAKFLDAAADMVKPGGVLVYCVCSLQKEEAEPQIEAFLARRPGFARKPVSPEEIGGADACITRAGDLRTFPFHFDALGGMDGFYAARLERIS